MKPAFLALVSLLLVAACEGNSKMRSMSNNELTGKRDNCLRHDPSAPGQATACENIRKECERRRQEGNYAC